MWGGKQNITFTHFPPTVRILVHSLTRTPILRQRGLTILQRITVTATVASQIRHFHSDANRLIKLLK